MVDALHVATGSLPRPHLIELVVVKDRVDWAAAGAIRFIELSLVVQDLTQITRLALDRVQTQWRLPRLLLLLGRALGALPLPLPEALETRTLRCRQPRQLEQIHAEWVVFFRLVWRRRLTSRLAPAQFFREIVFSEIGFLHAQQR